MKKVLPIHSMVIGGTRGIGRAVAAKLIKRGDSLSILSRRPPQDPIAGIPASSYIHCDLLNSKKISRILQESIALHGLVTNVIFLQRWRGEGDSWEAEYETTLTGTKNAVEALCKNGLFSKNVSIVLVNSSAHHFISSEQTLGYHVARGGLTQMMRYYATTLAPQGIRVNSISLGTVLKHESRSFYEKNLKLTSLYKKIIPLGRMGTSEDIADAIAFLCSGESSFITGQNLMIDGGLSLQWHESLARNIEGMGNIPVTRKPQKK